MRITTRREAAAAFEMLPPCRIQWCGVAARLNGTADIVKLSLALARWRCLLPLIPPDAPSSAYGRLMDEPLPNIVLVGAIGFWLRRSRCYGLIARMPDHGTAAPSRVITRRQLRVLVV